MCFFFVFSAHSIFYNGDGLIYYAPETFTLKDGQTVTLRSPVEGDAAVSLAYLRLIMGETDYLSAYPDEIDGDVTSEAAFLRGKLADPRSLCLSAYDACGAIVGNFDLSPVRTVCRYAHRATLGLSVRRDCWGLGLGSTLMQIMLREAKKMGYEQVELEVAAKNERAVALYEKFGFVKTGELPHFYKYRDGSYADAFFMVRFL